MSNDNGVPPIPPPPPGDDARPSPPSPPPGEPAAAQPNPYAAAEGTAGTTPPPYGAAPGAAPAPAATPGKGMAITALILGVLALLGAAIPILNIGSLLMAIVGLILGFVALNKYTTAKGLPISAIIVSAIATLLSLVLVIVYAWGFISLLQQAEEEGVFDPIPSASPEPSPDDTTDPDAEGPDDGPGDGDIFDPIATPDSGPGSLSDPLAVGETVVLTQFGDEAWEVTIDEVELDATELVITSNDINNPPLDGFQYAMVTITVTNISPQEANAWFAVEVNFRDADGAEYTQFDQVVTEPEPAWYTIEDLEPGETATGNLVVMIPTAGAEDGVWLVFSYYDSAGYFFQAQ